MFVYIGACVVGLGERVAALYSNNAELTNQLLNSSEVPSFLCILSYMLPYLI